MTAENGSEIAITHEDAQSLDASATLRARLVGALTHGVLEHDAQNLASALGRVLAQAGATPTLAATILDPIVQGREGGVLRAALFEAFAGAREEQRATEEALRWELPGCAAYLGNGRFAVCANPPHADDAAVAWADRTAAGLVKRGAREVVLSGEGLARKCLEEALELVGIPFVAEAPESASKISRFRFPWSK
jgi:hypothetical protein